MNKKFYVFIIMTIFLGGCVQEKLSDIKPNIIILQADDLGWDDLHLNGNKFVQTPGIDKLADESVIIDRFYVNPVCAPTRASLLTGRDFLLTGVSHVHGGKDFLSLDEKTFGDIFKNEGYRTGIWGKWHSGKTDGYFPWQRGFDEAYMSRLYQHKNSEGHLNGRYVKHNKWSDEVIVDYAINFIESSNDKPFIAYLSFLTCHAPLAAKEQIIQKYIEKGLSKNLSTLYAMIEQMDIEIKRLLSFIDKAGLRDNTIIVFMSDNGPAIINNWLSDEDRAVRYVNKLKGHKGNIWENGVKSTLLLSIPSIVKSERHNLLCDVTDIFPTLAEFAGIDLSKYNLHLTGKSFAANLMKENYSRPNKVVFNYANRGWPPSDKPWSSVGVLNEYLPLENDISLKNTDQQIISLTSEKYKLLKNPSRKESNILDENGYVLVEIENDLTEEVNLSKENSVIYNKMRSLLYERFSEITSSKNVFAPIKFNIDSKDQSQILLYAPKYVSDDLKIAFNYSSPWNKKGMYAEYIICSDTNFIANPVIVKEGNCKNSKYKLSIKGFSAISIKSVSDSLYFSEITIPKGENILCIENTKSENNSEEIKFLELNFTKKIMRKNE